MNRRLTTIALLAALAIPAFAFAADAPATENDYAQIIDKLMPGMAAKEIPARQGPQQEFEKLCHEAAAPGKEAQRAALSKAMIAKVGADAPKTGRVWLLRKIETLGGEEAVAGLAALLADNDAEIRDLARRALANNPSPKAAAALREALDKAADETWQVALINALGWRNDTQSVASLLKLAQSKGPAVVAAAAAALGDIADDAALKALAGLRKAAPAEARSTVVDASLRAAEKIRGAKPADALGIYQELMAASEPEHVRIAALTGMGATADKSVVPRLIEFVKGKDARMQMIAARSLQSADKGATATIVDALKDAPAAAKALLIEALGARGDATALKAVVGQLGDADATVRIAALAAIGSLGDSSVVATLVERAAKTQGDEREAARKSLATLKGKDIDATIVKTLQKAEGATKAELLYAVWGRRTAEGKPFAMAGALDKDEAVRMAAFTALERLGSAKDLPIMVDLLLKTQGDGALKAAEEALTSACRRTTDDQQRTAPLVAALGKGPAPAQAVLVRVLAKYQTPAALTAVREAAKSQDAAVRDAAKAALAQWKPVVITQWQVTEAFTQEGKGPQELFDIAFPPESGDAGVKWKAVKAGGNGQIGFGGGDNRCAYARVTLQSKEAQDVILAIGSDDGVKVWLNGEVIHAKNVTRGLNCGEDQVKASLKEGSNTLLLKVTQGAAGWEFCCGLKAADGGPVDGVGFEAR